MVLVLLADGFEEIEALTQVDFLRRAGIEVRTLGLEGRNVLGSHGIPVTADAVLTSGALPEGTEMVLLPGGAAGVEKLAQNAGTAQLLKEANAAGLWLAAICAAPTVLAAQGYLSGLQATCYPGWEKNFPADVQYTGDPVTVLEERRIITGRSVGVSGSFALALIRALRGSETAEKVKAILRADW